MTDTLTGMLSEEDFIKHFYDSSSDEYLEHFGKKGMKWGVRKTENSSDRPPMSTGKKIAISGAVVGSIALASIGGYAVSKVLSNPDVAKRIVKTGTKEATDRVSQIVRTLSNRKMPPSGEPNFNRISKEAREAFQMATMTRDSATLRRLYDAYTDELFG